MLAELQGSRSANSKARVQIAFWLGSLWASSLQNAHCSMFIAECSVNILQKQWEVRDQSEVKQSTEAAAHIRLIVFINYGSQSVNLFYKFKSSNKLD